MRTTKSSRQSRRFAFTLMEVVMALAVIGTMSAKVFAEPQG
jgi:prepilin-type N-terminal cleavage/methylation domain-containing protein